MNIKRKIILIVVMVFSLVAAYFVVAVPEGPSTLDVLESTYKTAYPNVTNNASAGNVTHFNIVGKSMTQSWQGYAGNISGTISLEDSSGFVMYDWSLADPEGEIYATYMPTVDWTNGTITCWNWSYGFSGYGGTDADYVQLDELEGWDSSPDPSIYRGAGQDLGMATDDVDGVNETFNYTWGAESGLGGSGWSTHSPFYVGISLINGSCNNRNAKSCGAENWAKAPCPSVRTYGTNASGDLPGTKTENATFEEVLLYSDGGSDATRGVIYASILQSNVRGYNNKTWDFQMMVGEDGHDGDTKSTTYYFFVELE